MEINQKVVYYTRPANERAGFDPEMEGQYETKEGLLIAIVNLLTPINGSYFSISKALLEESPGADFILIDCDQLKSFVIDND
jgi:hypothetical protein